MSTMNVGEYGLLLAICLNYDSNAFTALSLVVTRPDGTSFTRTNPAVAIGTSPLTTDLGTFPANQYVTYTTQDGDISGPGLYLARVIYTDSTKKLISDFADFTVNP